MWKGSSCIYTLFEKSVTLFGKSVAKIPTLFGKSVAKTPMPFFKKRDAF
jgi:hypothetical protein